MTEQHHAGKGDNIAGNKNVYINTPSEKTFDPQILQDYYQRIQQNYLNVILNDPANITLKDIYVEPYFSLHESCFEQPKPNKDSEENPQSPDKTEAFKKLDQPQAINKAILQLLRQKQLPQNITYDGCGLKPKADIRLIFLLGQPGQGKTSFCHRLVYDLVNAEDVQKPFFYIRLRDIDDVKSLMYHPLDTLLKEAHDCLDTHAFSKAVLKKSIWMLDGLDELEMSSSLEKDLVNTFCEKLQQQVEKYPNLQIIVTSRLHYIDLDRVNDKHAQTLVAKLEGLTLEQQKRWQERYEAFYPNKFPLEKLHKYAQVDEDSQEPIYQHLYDLIQLPILLYFVAQVAEDLTQNASRAKVYEMLFDVVLERPYANHQQIAPLKELKRQKRKHRRILQDIAFEIFKSDYEYIHLSKIATLPSVEGVANFKDSIKNLLVSFYFKKVAKHQKDTHSADENRQAIEFLHKSLQEYLTAEKIWEELLDFSEKNREEEFMINDKKVAFEKLSKLLAFRHLDDEIQSYLLDIFEATPLPTREIILERLMYFFPYIIKHEFLYLPAETNQKRGSYLTQSSNFCYNFCFLLVKPIKGRDSFVQLGQESKEHFANFIKRTGTRGLQLNNQNLQATDLSFSKVILYSFEQTNLSKSTFSSSYIAITHFYKANLSKTSFGVATLNNVFLDGTVIENSDFSRANIHHTTFIKANLESADFSRANIHYTDFIKANLENSSFSKADIHDTDFNRANLHTSTFFKSNIQACNFLNTNLNHAFFRYASLIRSEFNNGNLANVDLVSSNIIDCEFINTDLTSANFTQAILKKVNLTDAILKDALFKNTIMSATNYQLAKEGGAILENVTIIQEEEEDLPF